MKTIFTITVLLLSICQISFGQIDTNATNQLLEFDLEQLVTTPSKVKFSKQESPGIISVITDKEIIASGANDLVDALKLLPGISFQSDVQGVVGIGMRGIWGHEGKVLVLIDGQEMNELLYGNVAFGNHFDVTQIKRIEVVRGPGSSVYGGFAELGVINIITKNAEELQPLEINTSAGFYNDSYAHRNVSVKSGKQWKKYGFSIMGFLGQSQKSNQNYTDIYGTSTTLKNHSAANPSNLNIGFNYKDFSAKVIFDSYQLKSKISYDELDSIDLPNNFSSINGELKYKFALTKNFKITPKYQYLHQYPWQNTVKGSTTNANILTQKQLANIEFEYNVSRSINILAGVESFIQSAQNYEPLRSPLHRKDSTNKFSNISSSAYLQGTFKSDIVNITLGGRYLYNNLFGAAFSPRLAITKAFDDLHFKLLYSSAFKTPTLMNIALNDNIKPEKTDVYEFECGYRLNSYFDITTNVFAIKIKNPIVYEQINDADHYDNHVQTGSMGFETTLKWKFNNLNIDANYSYYNTNGLNKIDNYALSNTQNSVLGFSNHMANLITTYHISEHFTVNSTLSFIGERYAYKFGSYNVLDNTYYPQLLPQTFQWNVFVNKNNLIIENLDAGIGINNILNQEIYFAQPYNSLNTIYPAFNRSINLKVGYKF